MNDATQQPSKDVSKRRCVLGRHYCPGPDATFADPPRCSECIKADSVPELQPNASNDLVAQLRSMPAKLRGSGVHLGTHIDLLRNSADEIEGLQKRVDFAIGELAEKPITEAAAEWVRVSVLTVLRGQVTPSGDVIRPAPEPRTLPEIGGDTLPTTLAQFELRAKHFLADEQQKPTPDNALIGFLCDAVRLARENERMAKTGLGPPTVPEWRPIETAPHEDGSTCIVAVPNYNNKTVKNPPMLVGEAHYIYDEDALRSQGWFWAGEDPTDAHGPGNIYPTHWMPLPEAPCSTSTKEVGW